jgi:inner membrane protein
VDNLTHSLTGIMLARAGLERLTPRAAWILFLATNVPDVDVVSALGGSLNFLHFHRHLTHSFVVLPVLALLCVLAVRVTSRKRLNWIGACCVAVIGVGSHLLLDLTNIYGVRVLLPFSAVWVRLDTASVIDFWIWGALLVALFAPVLSRLVNSEIGATVSSRGGARRGFAIFALCFLVLYYGARYVAHARATTILDSRIYSGAAPLRVGAFPTASVLRWRGLAETAEGFSIQDVDLLAEFDPNTGRMFYKPEPSPALEAARRHPVFQQYLRFAQFPYWQLTPAEEPEGATRVEAMDLRFGDPHRPSFVCTAIVDAHQHVVRAWFQFNTAQPR